MVLEFSSKDEQLDEDGWLANEEQHKEPFGWKTIEGNPPLLSEEQSDGGWNESIIEDENAVVESSFFPENSILMNLTNLLTESEKVLINEFREKMENIVKKFHENGYRNPADVTLERMEHLIDEYLKRKIRLNLRCDQYEYTVSNFVFSKIVDISCSVIRITPNTVACLDENGEYAIDDWEKGEKFLLSIASKLLLAGAKISTDLCLCRMIDEVIPMYDQSFLVELKKIKNELESIAYEGIVNKNEQAQVDNLTVEVDNNLVFFKWPQNSIIAVVKVVNGKVSENFNIETSILQIGKSIVRVESIGGKRNYTDVLEGGIEMSFSTEVGKISIYLGPRDEGSNRIKVDLDEKSKERFDKLKDQSSLGESCLLGGKSVLQAVKDGGFERNCGILIELAETIKQSDFVVKESGIPSTFMRSVDSLDQLQKMEASKGI